MALRALVAVAIVLPGLAVASANPPEFARCLEADSEANARALDITIHTMRGEQETSDVRATLYLRRVDAGGFRALLRVAAPEELRGTAALWVVQESGPADLFVYLPALEKVQKLKRHHLEGSLFETDLTYSDIELLLGLARAHSAEFPRVADLGGRSVWVLEGPSSVADAVRATPRMISYVDRETCLPIRTEIFDSEDRISKVVEAEPERTPSVDEALLPWDLRVLDLRGDSVTTLSVETIPLDRALPDEFFDQATLAPADP